MTLEWSPLTRYRSPAARKRHSSHGGPGPDVGVGVRSETFGFWACHQKGAKTSLDKRPWKTKGGSWEIIVVVRGSQK
jgi:hypothetical protein